MYQDDSRCTDVGQKAQFDFACFCAMNNVTCVPAPKCVDMQYHIDYNIVINGNLLGVDVKNDKFGHKGVACFELEVPEKTMERYAATATYYSPYGINCGWTTSTTAKYNATMTVKIKGDYVGYVMNDGVYFIERTDGYMVNMIKNILIEKSPNPRALYPDPKAMNNQPYLLSCNRSANQQCLCTYLPMDDVRPYMLTLDQLKEKYA